MARFAPVHPGNGVLHWGGRFEIPDDILAVPVTLLRGKSDLSMDRLRTAVMGRATRTHTFRLMDLQHYKLPDAPEGATWTAWVRAERRPEE